MDIPSDLIFCDSYTRKVIGRGFFEYDCNKPEEEKPVMDNKYRIVQSVLRMLFRWVVF